MSPPVYALLPLPASALPNPSPCGAVPSAVVSLASQGKGMRFVKNVGLGFKTPKLAKEGNYVDKKCPFTGDVSIRGRILKAREKTYSTHLPSPPSPRPRMLTQCEKFVWCCGYALPPATCQPAAASPAPSSPTEQACTKLFLPFSAKFDVPSPTT